VENELWRQWQAFAAMMAPGGQAETPGRAAGPAFGPFTDAAERFTSAARQFLEGATHASAPATAEAARVFGDSLREQFTDLFQLPWNSGRSGAGQGAASAFSKDAPALGLTREHLKRWQRTTDAWRRTDEAQRRLQRLWSDALRDAAAAFAARIGPLKSAASGETLDGLYDSWIDCAEEAYARTAHSDAFCSALADFANASGQWRQALQADIEQWAKLLDLPTRSEISTLTQRLRSVELKLRAAQAPSAPPAPRPARKRHKARAAASKTRPGRSKRKS
jgi:hypothetical protein